MAENVAGQIWKDQNVKKFETEEYKICDVASYIRKINQYLAARRNENSVIVYRGESEIYPTSCRANIFRKGVLDGNRFFEKSLFDSMRQNYLTSEKRYLDNAIDAQHGEFPSRLLDVSYNCLSALYFAVTPYYHKEETALDDRDGMVFIFFVDEIFSPSAQNTNDNYDAIINRDKPWYTDKIIFEKNHKFIDHTKLNSRIIAQQGAFVLFQGNDAANLPACMTYGIRIPKEAKALIRKELRQLFGIHTGSIYPEIINLVGEISEKSRKLNTEEFNCFNELKLVIRNLKRELDYYLDYLVYQKEENGEYIDEAVLSVERVIKSYQTGLLDFASDYREIAEFITKEQLKTIIGQYNELIHDFAAELGRFGIMAFSEEALKITV